jgi:hypothetical protein
MLKAIPTGKNNGLTVGRMMREYMCEDQIMTEEKEGNYFVEGIFLQGDVKNNNKRVYPTSILEKAVREYQDNYIARNCAYGELSHPQSPKINLERVCILIENLIAKGNDFYGRARVAHEDCPMGKILRGLIKSGAKVGVSSRGLGSANKSKWQEEDCDLVDNFVLMAIDIVASPSAPDAYVEAIQEEKQYILNDSTGDVIELNEENYHIFEKQLKVMPVRANDKNEKVYSAIKNFLNSLR